MPRTNATTSAPVSVDFGHEHLYVAGATTVDWFVVHRNNKRLPPVALAFKQFLIEEGAAQIEAITQIVAKTGKPNA